MKSRKFRITEFSRKPGVGFAARLTAMCALLLFLATACSYRNPEQLEKDKNEEAVIAFLLTGSSFTATCPTNPTTVTFSQLGAAGVTANCAQHHSGVSPTAGFDITNYTQTLSRVVANNPSQSSLYQKVVTGTMAQYSNTAINEAILNWICSGATQ